jgi:hypothetical protein
VIVIIGLIALLAIPTVIWAAVHHRPERGAPEVPTSGPKHHWWQP